MHALTQLKYVVPILCLLFMAGCSSDRTEDEKASIEIPIPESMTVDVELEHKVDDGRVVWYDDSGEPFTGVQTSYFKESGTKASVKTYRDGLLLNRTFYDPDGELAHKHESEYEDGEEVRSTFTRPDGSKVEWITATETDHELRVMRQWYANGQLEFEMTSDEDFKYQGLMTKWDREGNIIAQEKYEDGELVAKLR